MPLRVYFMLIALLLGFSARSFVYADTASEAAALQTRQAEITQKQADIEELDRKIKELQQNRDQTAVAADLINHQLERLTANLAKARLELKQTQQAVENVEGEQSKNQTEAAELEDSIQNRKEQLSVLIQRLHQEENRPWVVVFFDKWSLSEVLAERAAYRELQEQTAALMQELRLKIEELKAKQEILENQAAELALLQKQQALQQQDIQHHQTEQKSFLQAKRGQQAEYENLLSEAKQAREEIAQAIFTLKDAGIKITLTDAKDMARLASRLTGVRPELILAVLKVETNVGQSIGSGKFPDDMQPASREPFLRITKKLGLDPYNSPISARPKHISGWGGAMGPAQIMPATWEGIEGRLAALMSKPLPNPYELTDAIIATAMLLADKGAASPAQELEAVTRYIAGPNWQYHRWYGDRVLAIAKEYQAEFNGS